MTKRFLTVGSAHWDILGRSAQNMALYDDVPGRIRRLIGGVAGPIAMKLGRLGADVSIFAYAGYDTLGEALIDKLISFDILTDHIERGEFPTDVYMGIEAPNGMVAAIADCQSLELVSPKILALLQAGGHKNTHVVIDGNVSEEVLAKIAHLTLDVRALTLVPASPGKIHRFLPFIGNSTTSLIVNLREANAILSAHHDQSQDAAEALIRKGFAWALVSNGEFSTGYADQETAFSQTPPQIEVRRFTGAGDTLSAHFLFHKDLLNPEKALAKALHATAQFISQEDQDA